MKQPPASPSDKDYPRDHSLFLLKKTHIRLSDDGHHYREDTHEQIKFLNKRGVRSKWSAVVGYMEGHETVSNFKVRVVRPGGKWISRAITVADRPSSKLYSNKYFSGFRWKRASVVFPVTNSVMEYRYTKEGNAWLLGSHYLQEPLPVKRAVLTVSAPKNIGFRSKVFPGARLPSSTIKYTASPDPSDSARTLHRWEVTNVPAIRSREAGRPPWPARAARVQTVVAPYRFGKVEGQRKTWNDVAHFFTRLVGDRDTPSKRVEKKALELTKDAKTTGQKIRAIYQFVNNKIRYIAVGIGLGGWQPQSAEFTLSQRYGDCKAKAVLFKAMLAAVGVKSHLVLVRTRPLGKIDKNFPADFGVFNHAINYLPAQRKFMDTTNVGTVFGLLPGGDLGASVLVIKGKRGELRTLKPSPVENSLSHNRLELTRFKTRIEATWKGRRTGGFSASMLTMFEKGKLGTDKANMAWAKGQVKGLLKRMARWVRMPVKPKEIKVTGVTMKGTKEQLSVDFSVSFVMPTRKPKQRVVYVPMTWAQQGGVKASLLKPRKLYNLTRGLRVGKYINEVVFRKWDPVEVPANVSVNNPHVKYQLSCEKKDQYVSYRRDLLLPHAEVPLADHEAFRNAFASIREADRRIVILRRGYGDKDKDGVKDNVDKCPTTPGLKKLDGCPDRDHDGIADNKDACPDVKGVPNDDATKNGCPKVVLVKVTKSEIKILQKIFFRFGSARIHRKSHKVLDQVAEVLGSRPEIRVRVEGHTDNVGSKRGNLRLSKRRAASVKQYLVKKGVAAERLESEGYGMSKPLVPNTSRKNRGKNRRVQFTIQKKDDDAKKTDAKK